MACCFFGGVDTILFECTVLYFCSLFCSLGVGNIGTIQSINKKEVLPHEQQLRPFSEQPRRSSFTL